MFKFFKNSDPQVKAAIISLIAALVSGIFLIISVLIPSLVNVTANKLTRSTPTSLIATITNVATHSSQTPIDTIVPSPSSNNTPIFSDPLNRQDTNEWDEGSFGNGGCKFIEGTYHASATEPGADNFCVANITDFRNFKYQVNMQIIKGDCGGLIFRADTNSPNSNFYWFDICQDGTYSILIHSTSVSAGTPVNTSTRLTYPQKSPSIITGIGKNNLIAVIANGSMLDFFVNSQKIISVSNSTYSHGQIGIIAHDMSSPTEVAFSNAQVWSV